MVPLCRQHDSLLLVIDIQERLASAMRSKPLERLKENTGLLVEASQVLDIPVFQSEQYPRGLGDTVENVRHKLSAHSDVMYAEKTRFSCCGEAGFEKGMRNSRKRQIIITGMETHVCVLQTAFELAKLGYEIYVVEDAVTSRRKAHHKNALHRMQQHGIIISNTESVLFEWLRDASHPHFKTLSQKVK